MDYAGVEMSKPTEGSMIELLHERYGTRSQGNGRRYVAMSHVRSDAGFDAKRTADFLALDLWPSKGLALHGHEVKISRSDWLNELKDPTKSGEFMKHVDYWWLVIADASMVKVGELPQGWGMMTIGGDGKLRVTKQAPRLTPVEHERGQWGTARIVAQPVHRGLVASMLRCAANTASLQKHRELTAFHDEWKATHSLVSEEWDVKYRSRADDDKAHKRFPTKDAAVSWVREQVAHGRNRYLFEIHQVTTRKYETRDYKGWGYDDLA
jgi:hypothetical protein